jgi:hypothetical protein
MRHAISLHPLSRAPWSLREADFPIGGTSFERMRYLLRYAILAPSTKNTQPWKFVITGDRIAILPDFTRWLRSSDRDQRELHISLGCALENLIVAADHFGYACDVMYGASADGPPEAVVNVRVQPAVAGTPRQRPAGLFEGLTSRQTIHDAFTSRRVPPAIRRVFSHLATETEVRLLLRHDGATTCALGALNADADVAEFSDASFRWELAHLVGQGVFGNTWAISKLGQIALPHLDNGASLARHDAALMKNTLVGLISTMTDDRASQIKAGQLFERLCLMAAILGVSVHPMSQALQIPTLRREVGRVGGTAPFHPQQLFRIGYAAPRARSHTPRRSVDQVIVQAEAREVGHGCSDSTC